jgi:hypothetical protein
MELKPSQGSRVSRGTRLSIGAQVLALVVLAFAAASLVTWLAARPGLRARFDLTTAKLNTLDPALADLISKTNERIGVDFFFQPEPPPLDAIAGEAQRKMRELLFVARSQFPSKFRVIDHDLSDLAAVQTRMKELGLAEANVVVVELDGKRVVLRLLKDLVRIHPGNPAVRQDPSIEAFLGESALANAILRVSIGQSPKVWFTTGHGERDLYDVETSTGLGRLHTALTADGFASERWDSRALPRVADDVRIVAVLDARQPFQREELDALESFVNSGGRLLVAASSDDRSLRSSDAVERLVERFGVKIEPGIVAQPIANAFGELITGRRECATIVAGGQRLDPRHPITESLWRGDKRVGLPNTRPLARNDAEAPANAAIVDIVRSPPSSWRDLPNSKGEYDYRPDPEREGDLGSSVLAFAANFRPPQPRSSDPEAAERERSRVLVLGGADALANGALDPNRDFVLNAFNWLAEREERLRIAARVDDRRIVQDDSVVVALNRAALFGLPLACALLGALLAWRRRK